MSTASIVFMCLKSETVVHNYKLKKQIVLTCKFKSCDFEILMEIIYCLFALMNMNNPANIYPLFFHKSYNNNNKKR